MWNYLYALLYFLIVFSSDVGAQISIHSLHLYGDTYNLETVTLQGIVRLSPTRQRAPGGKCGAYVFTLEDETGAIEVAVRRPARMIPLVDGDRVQVSAQVQVLRQADLPPRVCVQATDIRRLGK